MKSDFVCLGRRAAIHVHRRPALRVLAAMTIAVLVSLQPFQPLMAEEAAAASEPQIQETSPILAVIRGPSPRELTDRVMAIVRQVQPGPKTEGLPFILGGMLGDPRLHSFGVRENIGLALIAHEGEILPVFIVKLREGSPLRSSLPALSFALSDFGGWTIVRQEKVPEWLIERKEEALVTAVRSPRRYDIEIQANVPELAWILREKAQSLPATGPSGLVFTGDLLRLLAAEANDVSDFRIGLNLAHDRVVQAYYLKATEGSALAAFLDQKRPSDLDFARYISAEGAAAFLGGFDVEATRKYLEHLRSRIGSGAVGKPGPDWERLFDIAALFLRSTNGTSGGVMSWGGLHVHMSSIAPTTLTEAELVRILDQTAGLMIGWLQVDGVGEDMMPAVSFLPNHFTVDGVAVHVLRTETPGAGALPEQRLDMQQAIVDGYLLSASSLSRMSELVEAVRKGEGVEPSLASRLPIRERYLFEFEIQPSLYLDGGMRSHVPAALQGRFGRAQERQLGPIRGTVMARGGTAEIRVTTPVNTLVSVYRAAVDRIADQQFAER